MNIPKLCKQNRPLASIILFIAIFAAVQYGQPLFLYNSDGSVRQFGVGYKNKTIFPIWLFSIIVGIFSYLVVITICNIY